MFGPTWRDGGGKQREYYYVEQTPPFRVAPRVWQAAFKRYQKNAKRRLSTEYFIKVIGIPMGASRTPIVAQVPQGSAFAQFAGAECSAAECAVVRKSGAA
jgi:hypothetical protein